MKKVEIIPVARKKMMRRGISEDWVQHTVEEPAQIVTGHGARKVAHGKHFVEGKEYLLRVIFEETEHSYVVISAYLTSQVDRYWKENDREN